MINFLQVFADNTSIKIKESDLGLSGAPKGVEQAQVDGLLGAVYVVAGIVAVIAIIYGGIRYVTSNGDSSQIQSAKNTILYGVIGLIVVIAAAAITNFVIKNVK